MKRSLVLSIASMAIAATIVSANTTYAASKPNQGIPAQIQKLEDGLKSLLGTVTNHSQEISQLQQTVKSQSADISVLKQANSEQAQEIQSLQSSMTTQSNSIADLHSTVAAEQQSIHALQSNQANQAAQLSQLSSEVNQLQQAVNSLEQQSPNPNPSPPPSPTGPYTISGTLKDSNGTPFFSPLYLVGSNGKSLEEQSTFSSATGQFSFTNVPDGTYTFKFGMPEYQFTSPKVTVDGGNVTGLNLTTNNPVYDISGVALSNGQPLAHQSVIIFDPYGYTGGYFGPGATDANGKWSFHGIPNGTYTIYIGIDFRQNPSNPAATALASGTVTVNNGNVTGVVLNRLANGSTSQSTGYNVEGTMYDATGKQIGASLHLVGSDGVTHLIDHMTSTGQFVFANIPDGTYTLTTKDPMYPVTNPQTITVNGQDVSGLNVNFGMKTYTVTFQVYQNGAPFAGNVYYRDTSQTFTRGPITTASDGTFKASQIAAGSWTIYTGPNDSSLTPLGTVQVTDGSSVVKVGQ